ncbi:MAG: DUF1573 domain-containing protein, partial [Bacteroidales bacterium]
MKLLLITYSLLVFSIPGNAGDTHPEKGAQFKNRIYDFGNIREDDGIRTCEFEFINTAVTPLTIEEVRSSCGCTLPEFEQKKIQKGEKGLIRVGYDPVNRPGIFERMLIVAYRESTKTDTLIIKGQVAKSEL